MSQHSGVTTWPQAMKNLFVAGGKFILVVWAFMGLALVALAPLGVLILWLTGHLGALLCQ